MVDKDGLGLVLGGMPGNDNGVAVQRLQARSPKLDMLRRLLAMNEREGEALRIEIHAEEGTLLAGSN